MYTIGIIYNKTKNDYLEGIHVLLLFGQIDGISKLQAGLF